MKKTKKKSSARNTKRVAGLTEVSKLVRAANQATQRNGADSRLPNILYLADSRLTSSPERRDYLLRNLQLGSTELLRLKTSLGGELSKFTEQDMDALVDLLVASRVWGLNLGEFRATDAAWTTFANRLDETLVGFVWINEKGKDAGASPDVHDWLLGIRAHANNGVLRGKNSPLARNRRKKTTWYTCPANNSAHGGLAPWRDGCNPVVQSELARKFLYNPSSSKFFVK